VHFNLEIDPRRLIGDNEDDISDIYYGNNDVVGFKEIEEHGTMVAGIIAAEVGNGIGIDGIANNRAIIMPIRAIPGGDEYDKDVALAIRYAIDNGARIINMSFGKRFSAHPDWVRQAIQFAESKDVLVVMSAGNDGVDLDHIEYFPNDIKNDKNEHFANVLTVGSITNQFNENLVSRFSNYGKQQVDVFAPGSEIYSTKPNDRYEFDSGTSMAAPVVTGIAVLLRAYFPTLTAADIKEIIMTSGVEYTGEVISPGSRPIAKKLSDLCASGKIANVYNAIILAEKRVKEN
jgi:subtilisin family serine protease